MDFLTSSLVLGMFQKIFKKDPRTPQNSERGRLHRINKQKFHSKAFPQTRRDDTELIRRYVSQFSVGLKLFITFVLHVLVIYGTGDRCSVGSRKLFAAACSINSNQKQPNDDFTTELVEYVFIEDRDTLRMKVFMRRPVGSLLDEEQGRCMYATLLARRYRFGATLMGRFKLSITYEGTRRLAEA